MKRRLCSSLPQARSVGASSDGPWSRMSPGAPVLLAEDRVRQRIGRLLGAPVALRELAVHVAALDPALPEERLLLDLRQLRLRADERPAPEELAQLRAQPLVLLPVVEVQALPPRQRGLSLAVQLGRAEERAVEHDPLEPSRSGNFVRWEGPAGEDRPWTIRSTTAKEQRAPTTVPPSRRAATGVFSRPRGIPPSRPCCTRRPHLELPEARSSAATAASRATYSSR